MDYTKYADAGTAGSAESIKFDEKIYWVSALVDVLRDNTKELLELTTNGTADNPRLTAELCGRYTRLRDEAAGLLSDEEAGQLRSWTRDLSADVTADEVYEAASNLARCLDVVIQLPVFVASRVSQRTEIHTVLTRAGTNPDKPAGMPTAPRAGGSGQYL